LAMIVGITLRIRGMMILTCLLSSIDSTPLQGK
jgi:hypothetical protein